MDTPRPTRKHTSGSSHEAAPTGPNESADRSTLEILMAIADDTRHLLQKEVELARHEIVEALLAKAKAAAALAAAGIIGLMVLVFAGLTAAAALDNVLPPEWGERLGELFETGQWKGPAIAIGTVWVLLRWMELRRLKRLTRAILSP